MSNSFFPILPESNRLERIWKLGIIDFRKRYYGSYLGLLWAFLNPVFRLFIYYTIFTVVFKSNIPNYGFYLFLGLLFWLFFAEGTNKCFPIFRTNRYLIENIQFNKIDLFYSSILSTLIGFLFNLSAYLIISILSGIPLTVQILWLPFFIINTVMVVLGINLILATAVIYLKDLHQVWGLVLLAGIWLTPIFYGRSALFDEAPFLLYINPIAGIIINAREAILYGNTPDIFLTLYNLILAILLIVIGLFFFKKYAYLAVEKM